MQCKDAMFRGRSSRHEAEGDGIGEEVRLVPDEFASYFVKKYSELKEKAKTYGELKILINQEWKAALFSDTSWGNLLYEQLKKLLENDLGSLCIR